MEPSSSHASGVTYSTRERGTKEACFCLSTSPRIHADRSVHHAMTHSYTQLNIGAHGMGPGAQLSLASSRVELRMSTSSALSETRKPGTFTSSLCHDIHRQKA